MKKAKVHFLLKVISAIICMLCSIFNFIRYNEYSMQLNHNSPVNYTLAKTTKHSGGRGSHYDAIVVFNGKHYKVNSTSRMNTDLENKIYPSLYYISYEDKIISDWDVVLAGRLSALFLFGFVAFTFFAYKQKHPPL